MEELISIIKEVKSITISNAVESLPHKHETLSVKIGELVLTTDPDAPSELQFQAHKIFKDCLDTIDNYAQLQEAYTNLEQDYKSILLSSGLDDFEKILLKNVSQFLGETIQFGILDPSGPILEHNLSQHTVDTVRHQLQNKKEYSISLSSGELYACQYKDFTIIVERQNALSTNEKNHIKLTVKYISLQRMQNTLQHAMMSSLEEHRGAKTTLVNNIESSLQKGLNSLVKDATIDPLTLAFNRGYLLRYVEQLYKHNLPFSIIITDIDYFKRINHTYGHDIGDQMLSEFVQILIDNTRNEDIIVRWGGEEFLILLESAELDVAANRAEILRSKIEKHQFEIGQKITASFGVASTVSLNHDFKALVKEADQALHQAKTNGRNCVKCKKSETDI